MFFSLYKASISEVLYSFLEDSTDRPSLVLQHGLGQAGGHTVGGAAPHIGGQGGIGGIIGGTIGGTIGGGCC